jgi:hypothetical protein
MLRTVENNHHDANNQALHHERTHHATKQHAHIYALIEDKEMWATK